MSQEILNKLKRINFEELTVTLALLQERKQNRASVYKPKFVSITGKLETRLKKVIVDKINHSEIAEEYKPDCEEPEEDMVKFLSYETTDFYKIFEKINELNPEIDKIEKEKELLNTKAYLIILNDKDSIKVVGYKILPENWKLKKQKNLISLSFTDDIFDELEESNLFTISSSIDFIYFDELLFILSKKNFELGMNFRLGMLQKADDFYSEIESLELMLNTDILKNRVGNNQRYLRKIATIKNLGHYKNLEFIQKMKELSLSKGWIIDFKDHQIIVTEESLDEILILLQNKRLFSEITLEDFDVESAKKTN